MPAIANTDDAGLREIKSILRSLLISASSRDTTIRQLNGLYKDMESRNIPFREFNYSNLHEFLESMPDTLQMRYNRDGEVCAYHVDTDKTRHVSSLVARQKKPPKRSKSTCTYRPRNNYQRYQSYARPATNFSSPVSDDIVSAVLSQMKYAPGRRPGQGIRKADILSKVRERIGRNIMYTIQHLTKNLNGLSYLLLFEADCIYFKDELTKAREEQRTTYANVTQPPMDTNSIYKSVNNHNMYQQPGHTYNSVKQPVPINNNTVEQSVYSNDFKPQTSTPNKSMQPPAFNDCNRNVIDEQQSATPNCNGRLSDDQHDQQLVESAKTQSANDEVVKERTKIRLQKLIEKHPEGIWCAELPSLYKSEYNLNLEYNDMGFNSITEFVAALPNIFSIVEPPNTNRQMVIDARKINSPTKNHKTKTLASLYNFDDYIANEPEPIPTNLSLEVTRTLIPEGVMTLNENVDQISVSSLVGAEYIEVNLPEIFTPSFFWITLRKNKKKIEILMRELHEFYSNRDLDTYKIPQVVLQPGLNVACTYANMWHRGIVHKIKPDGFVVIAFYDYGTVRTYNPNDLYFLNKKFSALPAQAIACGLYNIRPIGSTEWSNEAYNRFVDRVWQLPLIAFINNVNEENNSMMVTLTDTSDDEVDVHINDWMVEHHWAEFGKMINAVPLHKLSMYDELELKKMRDEQKKLATRRKSKDSVVQSNDLECIDSKVSSVISSNPSSCYIDSLCETFNVATLLKENTDLMKQTHTITQAILLNMPDNKTGISNNNSDTKIVETNGQHVENQHNAKTSNPDNIQKFTAEFNKNLNSIKVNISEMKNDKYFETEFIQNEPVYQKKSVKDNLDYRSTMQSAKSHLQNTENKSVQQNNNYYNGPVKSNSYSGEYVERRSSIHSTRSSNYDFHTIEEEEFNDSDCDSSVCFNNGTLEIKLQTNLPKSRQINIKYPSNFANSNFKKPETQSNCTVNGNKILNGNSTLLKNSNEGNTTKTLSSQICNENNNSSSSSTLNTLVSNSSVFTLIHLSDRCERKAVHMFHLDNEGWVSTSEFVDAFTNLKDQRVMVKLLQILEYEVSFKELTRVTDPQLFSQLDKSKLKAPREDNKIAANFTILLMPLKSTLQVLVKLDFLNSKMLKEANRLMKQCKEEDLENVLFEQYNNKILYDVLNLLVQYKHFKRSLKSANQ